MKIVITGAAGAIGSHLSERLTSLGHEVVGIDSLTDYYNPDIKKINLSDIEAAGAKVIEADLVDDDLTIVPDDTEIIFHLAAQPGISASTPFDDYLNNNIVATERLIECAKKIKNLKMFVNVATSSVYGREANGDESVEPKPTSHYGVTKLAAEQLALAAWRDQGLPVTSLRFFSVYGERERPEKLFHKLIKAMCEETEFPLYEGSESHVRSYTYVGDIIDGCLAVLDNREKVIGEIINLGNDQTNTTGEGIKIIEEIFGKPAKLKIVPKRAGDQLETAANITKAKKLFNYQPKVDLKTGLAAEVKWYREKIDGKI